MDFTLNEDQRMVRDSAREFLAAEWSPAAMRRMLEEPRAASQEFWSKAAGLGWPGMSVPEEYGGLGLGAYDLALLMEEMGRRLVPGTFFSTGVLAARALMELGTSEAKAKYLPRISAGQLRATLAVFEPGLGWDLDSLSTQQAVQRLTVKSYVPEASLAQLILCAVREPERVCLVIPRNPKITNQNALDPTRPLSEVRFDRADGEIVGQGSLQRLQGVMDFATIALAAEMVGASAAVLDATVAYVKSREQFGRPVGSFQAVQHRAADMMMALEKARTAAYYAAIVADEESHNLSRAASLAKVASNRALTLGSQQAIQLHGGLGFTWEQDLHLYLKRAKSAEFTLGNTEWHLDRIAEELGLTA